MNVAQVLLKEHPEPRRSVPNVSLSMLSKCLLEIRSFYGKGRKKILITSISMGEVE